MSKIAVVGAGLMGSGWAATFLAHGHEVIASDPREDAEESLRRAVDRAWVDLQQLGEASGKPDHGRLSFVGDRLESLADAVFVQESTPERPDLKKALFSRLDAILPPEAIIASSSSGIPVSIMQQGCSHPERTIIGHPMNPPHVMPLVEVVGGQKTATETIDKAMNFYRSLHKHPIRLGKELPGHVVNRVQAAIARESIHLVAEGVVSVADLDTAMTLGPGLRSALIGPLLNMSLASSGSFERFLAQYGGLMAGLWRLLGQPQLTPELQKRLVEGVHAELGSRTPEQAAAERDQWVTLVRKALAQFEAART